MGPFLSIAELSWSIKHGWFPWKPTKCPLLYFILMRTKLISMVRMGFEAKYLQALEGD